MRFRFVANAREGLVEEPIDFSRALAAYPERHGHLDEPEWSLDGTPLAIDHRSHHRLHHGIGGSRMEPQTNWKHVLYHTNSKGEGKDYFLGWPGWFHKVVAPVLKPLIRLTHR